MKRRAAGRGLAGAFRGPIAAGLTAATLTAALAACGSSPPTATTASVTSTPGQVAATALGTVGYRELGSGPPLVLIMGYAGTMETWEPQLVDTLARHFRVVIFDNAGIGGTRALPSPLTIDAMANQTSALISALGLGRPDVLGWSMGGMIAQALAVLHPGQVRRLVLCATFPGVGTVDTAAGEDRRPHQRQRALGAVPGRSADGGGRVRGRGAELRRPGGGVGRRDLGPGRRLAGVVPRRRRGRPRGPRRSPRRRSSPTAPRTSSTPCPTRARSPGSSPARSW